jgi:hypothetical protein
MQFAQSACTWTKHRVKTHHQNSVTQEWPTRPLDIRSLSGCRREEVRTHVECVEEADAIANKAADDEGKLAATADAGVNSVGCGEACIENVRPRGISGRRRLSCVGYGSRASKASARCRSRHIALAYDRHRRDGDTCHRRPGAAPAVGVCPCATG